MGLNRFCDENPAIGTRIRALPEKNKARAISRRPITTVRPTIVRASDRIMDVISAAVPRYLAPDLRDDAIQNIWMAVVGTENLIRICQVTESAKLAR
jgi:hypothetical protein